MKTKKIKELENKISKLEKKLSEAKEVNSLFGLCLSREHQYPVIFSNTTGGNIFSGYYSGTNIKYFFEDKVRDFTVRYLGAPYDIKILRNTENHCIFECSDKSKYILNKAKEVISQLPDDTVFLKDFEVDNSATIKVQIEDGIFTIGCIKEK